MNLSTLKKEKLYFNCKVFHPDGDLMFRCSEKRANWYLNRNLAIVIGYNPLSIKLTFTPKGKANHENEYFLQDKENKCVVCGASEHLTKHHVVPTCFRKFFPENLKSRNFHDVLIVCVDCHSKYEEFALNFKKRLAEQNNSSVHFKTNTDVLISKKIAGYKKILENRDNHNIPESRIEKIKLILIKLHEKLKDKNKVYEKQHFGKVVVENLNDLHAFVKVWRIHFLEIMKPKHLPKGWSVDYKKE